MNDTFAITIGFIFVATIVAAFIKGRIKDKCLKSFSNFLIHLEKPDGKLIWGKLNVEHTGIELEFPKPYQDPGGYTKSSFILYKSEFGNIHSLIRFLDELGEKEKSLREKELKKTYHPSFLRRLGRKLINFFNTVKDSILDVMNLFMGKMKSGNPLGNVLSSQAKYTSKVQGEMMNMMNTSYEPLLEKHIGKKVIVELIKPDQKLELVGILKDYTSEFIEILDVEYPSEEEKIIKADLIVPRSHGSIRHLAE